LPVLVPPLAPVLPAPVGEAGAPAAAPPLLEPLGAAGAALADWLGAGAEDALELEALELGAGVAGLVVLVVVGVVVVLVVAVVVGVSASAEVGMVSAGASAVSAWGGALEPQPASSNATTTSTAGMSRDAAGLPRGMARDYETSSGAIRRAQWGQSLRSLGANWSHQLQKRRFSTAQGSSDAVGASGRSCATTWSSSPVSRSR
jgi:hypothetical protein